MAKKKPEQAFNENVETLVNNGILELSKDQKEMYLDRLKKTWEKGDRDEGQNYIGILLETASKDKQKSLIIGLHGFPLANELMKGLHEKTKQRVSQKQAQLNELDKLLANPLNNEFNRIIHKIDRVDENLETLENYNLDYILEHEDSWLPLMDCFRVEGADEYKYIDPLFFDTEKPLLLYKNDSHPNNFFFLDGEKGNLAAKLAGYADHNVKKIKSAKIIEYLTISVRDTQGKIGFREELGKLESVFIVKEILEKLRILKEDSKYRDIIMTQQYNKMITMEVKLKKHLDVIKNLPESDPIGMLAKYIIDPHYNFGTSPDYNKVSKEANKQFESFIIRKERGE